MPTSEGEAAARLRLAGREDASAIADVYMASRADALPFLPVLHTEADTQGWIAGWFDREGEVWVAELDGAIVGFLRLEGEDLDQLYLAPGYYRRGIGSRLIEIAKGRSPSGLHLFAFQANARARAFYERHGFVVFDFDDGDRNEEKTPDVQYEWRGALSRRAGSQAASSTTTGT